MSDKKKKPSSRLNSEQKKEIKNSLAKIKDGTFKKALSFNVKWEQGYNPADPSMHGITQNTYDASREQQGLEQQPVSDISFGEALDIYEEEFYKKPNYDMIPSQNAAIAVMDFGTNAGTGTSTKMLQSIVGAEPDGIIGNKTIGKVKDYITEHGEDELVNDLIYERENHYKILAEQDPEGAGKNLNGWLNRTADLGSFLNNNIESLSPSEGQKE